MCTAVLECRICLEPDVRTNLISPCACSGSQRWVHRNCLDKWLTTREDKAFGRCTECLQKYEIIYYPDQDNSCQRRASILKFIYLVVRDFLLAFSVLQMSIISLGGIVFLLDRIFGSHLVKLVRMDQYQLVSLSVGLILHESISTTFHSCFTTWQGYLSGSVLLD